VTSYTHSVRHSTSEIWGSPFAIGPGGARRSISKMCGLAGERLELGTQNLPGVDDDGDGQGGGDEEEGCKEDREGTHYCDWKWEKEKSGEEKARARWGFSRFGWSPLPWLIGSFYYFAGGVDLPNLILGCMDSWLTGANHLICMFSGTPERLEASDLQEKLSKGK